MSSEKISIIVPIYNVEKYLDRCIQSIVNQTYKKIEIILVDDGSSDNCPKICDAWAEKDSRIRVVHKENGGLSSARNAGLKIAQGEYLFFVDSDDWIDENSLEVLKESSDKGNADIVMAGFYIDYDNDEKSTRIIPTPNTFRDSDVLKRYLLDEIRPEMCGKLYKASLFRDLFFNETIKYGEDLEMNYHVMKKAKSIILLDECKYHYYQENQNAITAQYITENRIASYKITKSFIQKEKDNEELYNACVWRHARHTFALISRLIYSNNTELIQKYYSVLANDMLHYKSDILKNDGLESKYKIAVKFLSISPSLYLKICKLKEKFL